MLPLKVASVPLKGVPTDSWMVVTALSIGGEMMIAVVCAKAWWLDPSSIWTVTASLPLVE